MSDSYNLAEPAWGDEEINAIHSVIDSGFFSMGAAVQSFENEFANYMGSRFAVMVNSGSSANLLAVAALFYKKSGALKAGDEIIVPAVSWSTTYYPLLQYGLKVVFVDIDPETLNFNLDALDASITDKTRAILAVNLLGNPNDFDRVSSIIGERDILLIEDNCESLGAKYNGKYAGTFGLVGTFSTFFSHHMSTMEGGVVVTDDEELFHIMLSLRSHGWTRHLPEENLVTGRKDSSEFVESFKFVLPGYNLRPIEMSGAIGLEQLKKLPDFVAQRQENAQLFRELIDNPKIKLQKEIGESSWFGFSIVLDESISRDKFVNHLADNHVECRPIVGGNFVDNPVIEYFDYRIFGNLSNAELIGSQGLFVGNHPRSMEREFECLQRAVKSFW